MHEQNRRLPFRRLIGFSWNIIIFWQGTAYGRKEKVGQTTWGKKSEKSRNTEPFSYLINWYPRHWDFPFPFVNCFGPSLHQRAPWIIFILDVYDRTFYTDPTFEFFEGRSKFNKFPEIENNHLVKEYILTDGDSALHKLTVVVVLLLAIQGNAAKWLRVWRKRIWIF